MSPNMKTIDLEGLPEPLARAIETMVQNLRNQAKVSKKKDRGKLPLWRGRVIGRLSREELYDDVV